MILGLLLLSACSLPKPSTKLAPPPSPPTPTNFVRPKLLSAPMALARPPLTIWISWDWFETDLIGHTFSRWNVSKQQEEYLQFWVWTAPRTSGPWTLYLLTNRPPVPVTCTNPAAFFRISADYIKSPYQP